MEVELLNIPPVRVYQWEKNGRQREVLNRKEIIS
jgi:hypothetical protein